MKHIIAFQHLVPMIAAELSQYFAVGYSDREDNRDSAVDSETEEDKHIGT